MLFNAVHESSAKANVFCFYQEICFDDLLTRTLTLVSNLAVYAKKIRKLRKRTKATFVFSNQVNVAKRF